MRTIMIVLLATLCGCGALKRTKNIDRVKKSAEISVKQESVSDSKVKVEDKSIKEEKVSEKRSEDVITEREIFFDDSGRVSYIKEKVIESRKRDMEREKRDSMDRKEDSSTSDRLSSESRSESKVDSLKKETHLEQPENKVWSFVGWGLFIVFAAVALVVFIRFRK